MYTEKVADLLHLPSILVVDDDDGLRKLLSKFLSEQNFIVATACDAADARAKMEHVSFDLLIVDVMMPVEDGVSFAKSLRASGYKHPIMLLTALGEVEDRIKGLESGVDDYLPKPFEPKELLLRVKAILRRFDTGATVAKKKDILFGKWQFDKERGELLSDGERIVLTQAESNLLKALYNKRGEVISREELAEMCGMDAAERTIDVQITRLRKRLEEDTSAPKYIQTVRGKGYVLRVD